MVKSLRQHVNLWDLKATVNGKKKRWKGEIWVEGRIIKVQANTIVLSKEDNCSLQLLGDLLSISARGCLGKCSKNASRSFVQY